MKRIKFQGEEYLLTGFHTDMDGPIVKEDVYRRGELGYAHLGTDGIIRRFHREIGTIDDIEILEDDYEIEVDVGEFLGGLFGDSWPI